MEAKIKEVLENISKDILEVEENLKKHANLLSECVKSTEQIAANKNNISHNISALNGALQVYRAVYASLNYLSESDKAKDESEKAI